ncbi:MAG: MepB family protein [Bifidobacterium crudilactis]|jgi:hypothetical protein|nr:MepB family protein [Bifidobacterium crudilactis]MCI1889314.1 MepB family protein [Bifidobacterium crudilactis]
MPFTAFENYASCSGLTVAVTAEDQNSDYESGLARIQDELWHIRTARNTPTKPGAFVAFWRRCADGTTAPFTSADPSSGLLVFVHHEGRRGVFRFTKTHLDQLGITAGTRSGKRGFRVYPSWCTGLNASATKTQREQAQAFQIFA